MFLLSIEELSACGLQPFIVIFVCYCIRSGESTFVMMASRGMIGTVNISYWKRYNGQTYSCQRHMSLGIMGDQLRAPHKPLNTIVQGYLGISGVPQLGPHEAERRSTPDRYSFCRLHSIYYE